MDSGIRGGADVFRALALAGEAGVSEVIRNLLADFELTMGLAGCRSVAEITREALVRG